VEIPGFKFMIEVQEVKQFQGGISRMGESSGM
jgi:hypothetical protein